MLAILTSWLAFASIHQHALGYSLLGIALVCALLRGRLALDRSHWMLWTLLVLVVAVAWVKFYPIRPASSGLVYPSFFPVALGLGASLYPALLRRHTRREYWASLSLSGVFFLFCGLNFEPLTREFAAFSALWSIFFAMSALRYLTGKLPGLAAWVTLLPTMVLLGGITAAYNVSETQANRLMRLFSMGGNVGLSFPAQNRLNTMLQAESNPSVVVRCFSRRPETYLPARVYTTYNNSTWSEAGPSEKVSAASSRQRFPLSQVEEEPVLRDRFEINASPMVLLAPRDGLWLEAQSEELALLSGHLLEIRGGGTEAFRYSVGRLPGKNLAPPESPDYLDKCLELPQLDPIVGKLASEVMQSSQGPLLARAKHLESWFQKEFHYGFGHDYACNPDPIADFLINKPVAHCEIFASAMVLMLRTQGIPARYINGFVCVEPSLGGDYWVVRVRDAHAWVEMWDGEHWHTLDPTPPNAIQPPQDWMSWFDSIRESISFHLGKLGSLNWRQWLALIWSWKVYLGLLLIFLALRKMKGLRWLTGSRAGAVAKVEEHQWIRELSRSLEPLKLGREPWEGLGHWSRRLQDLGPLGQQIQTWLQEYQAHRYGGRPVGDLAPQWAELLTALRSLPSGQVEDGPTSDRSVDDR